MTRYNHKFVLYLLILFLTPVISYGQSFEQLNQLYQKKKMRELEQLIRNSTSETPEIIFFKTVFNENGVKSIRIYESLFSKTGGELKGLVAKKISEYYYALGFYVKASEYAKYATVSSPPAYTATETVITGSPEKLYFIQVGAFEYRDNANRMKELLKEKNLESDVKIRQVNGKTLYCVWVHGGKTYRDTKIFADELKQKYKLNYQIINP
jgi:hypothetical protein